MPIVIMQVKSSPIAPDSTKPVAVWDGTKAQAQEWCNAKNEKGTGWTTYHPVSVKTEKPCKTKQKPLKNF